MKRLFLILLGFTLFLRCHQFENEPNIIYAIEEFPSGLDPSINFRLDEKQIYSQLYETLLTLDSDYKTLVPNLAEKWHASLDNQTFTFDLRKDVYFHDYTKLSAISVKKSFEWLRDRNSDFELFEMIESLDVLDSNRVQIKLKYPYSAFLYTLTSPVGLQIISENALEKYGEDIKHKPVGTGPFFLKKWIDGKEIQLDIFDEYWNYIENGKEITFKYYENQSERENELAKGNVDILYAVAGYSIDRLKWMGKIEYHTEPAVSVFFLGFNNQTFPFNDKRVRKAILRAINVPKLVLNVNRGNAEIAKGPLSSIYFQYSNFEQSGYDLEEAKELLKQAGIEKGLTINFDFPNNAFTRQTIVETIKAELEKIGIVLNVRLHNSWEEYDKALSDGSAQMFINGGKSEIVGDAENILYGFFHSKSSFNSLNYHVSKIDEWLSEARLESDPTRRKLLYEKIVKQILDDIPAVFLYHVIPHFAYNSEKIKTLDVNPYGIIRFNKLVLN